jgi:hypothetical protein
VPTPHASRTAGLILGIVVTGGFMAAVPAAAVPPTGWLHVSTRSMETPNPTATPTPSGQTQPSPIRGLAPFGLVIGLLLIGGVSVLYGRRSQ